MVIELNLPEANKIAEEILRLENAEAMDGQNNKRAQRKIKNLENKIQKRLSQEKKDNLLRLTD